MFPELYIQTIAELSLDIAQQQRGIRMLTPMQDYTWNGFSYRGLWFKFCTEYIEFADTEDKRDEMPDLCYYTVLMSNPTQPWYNALWAHAMYEWLGAVCQEYGYTIEQLMGATLAKYTYRASGNAKDFDVEHQLIVAAMPD